MIMEILTSIGTGLLIGAAIAPGLIFVEWVFNDSNWNRRHKGYAHTLVFFANSLLFAYFVCEQF